MRGIAYRKSAAAQFLSTDYVFILACFAGTILLVMVSIEAGYRAARIAHPHSRPEKESPVSAIEGSVLALLAFILAFTFGIASNRFDARRELVRMEANAIRTAWYRSESPVARRNRAPNAHFARIWFTLGLLTFLGMSMVGYQAAVAKSERTLAMPVLAIAFASIVALIGSLDHPLGGFTFTNVSQQPLIDLLADIDSHRITPGRDR